MNVRHHGPVADPSATRPSRFSIPAPKPSSSLRYDIPAGLVVFLIALPLCLGVALACNAPLLSGLVAGCCGGLIVPWLNRSPLSVSGPSAAYAAIVAHAVATLGWGAVCAATFLSGVVHLILGAVRAGAVISFVQGSVIRGMLAAIGILLVLKQIPHAIGYDHENFASEAFEVEGEGNTFSLFWHALGGIEWGAALIGLVSALILIAWTRPRLAQLSWLPGALVVVVVGTGLSEAFRSFAPALSLESRHLVSVPTGGFTELTRELQLVDPTHFVRPEVITLAVTLGLVTALEVLLSLDAVDKLDPWRRHSDPNRELLAQGVANMVSGAVGGLPLTAVIVRSGANVAAGGRTRVATMVHGALLLTSLVFMASLLNRIPLAALATILVVTGLRLASPKLFRTMWSRGRDQFLPFIVTVVAILLTDLLRGVVIGIVVGQLFNIRSSMRNAISIEDSPATRTVKFQKDMFFFHKPAVLDALTTLPAGTLRVVIDAHQADYIEYDIREAIASVRPDIERRGAIVELVGIEPFDDAV